MIRSIITVLIAALLLTQPIVAGDAVQFRTADLVLDAGDHELAVWQVEITYDKAAIAIVGIEGGDKAPFATDTPPYYDRKGLVGGRIILANFTKSKDLRTGKQTVSRLHLQVTGDTIPELKLVVKAAADKAGKRFDATAQIVLHPVAAKAERSIKKMEPTTDNTGQGVIRQRMIEAKIRTLTEAGAKALRQKRPDYPTAMRHLIEADEIYTKSKIDSPAFVAGHNRLRRQIATVHLDYANLLITQGSDEESLDKLRKAEALIKTALKYDTHRAPLVEKDLKRIDTIKNQLPYEIEVE